jgi:3-hydroxybutyryl-CoA dehydratase
MSVPILDRSIDDIRVGDSETLTVEISEADIAAFAALSGDRNPLHMDDSYARSTAFGRRIAHGLLVAAPVSALAGHLLPGRRCLILEYRFKYPRPVFAGDRLVYRGTVTQVTPAVGTLRVDVQATNAAGDIVLGGSYGCQVLPPS